MNSISSVEEDSLVSERAGSGHRLYADHLKRVLDVTIVVLCLPFAVPIVTLVWLVIRLTDGPAFFVQDRVGRGGATFRCLKFRTMCLDAETVLLQICAADPRIAEEWATMQKLVRDPRVTPFGRFLRASRLDELPQLLNVLKGDMSLIGPRPFTLEQEAIYRKAGGMRYFEVRPGVTGPWQVCGSGTSQTPFVERIRFDEDYFDGLSFRADLRILWLTIVTVFCANGN